MITQIAYTNSNCSDLWRMFIGQNKKHTDIPLRMISDEDIFDAYVYGYTNDQPYYKVWSDAVEYFGSDYFIYLQEDFVLYDSVYERSIIRYVDFLHENPEYSFVRLLKATSFKNKKLGENLYEVESGNKNVFAMQPTIWRSKDYLKLLAATKETKWLETPNYRKAMIEMGMKGAYHYNGEPKAGKYHYDSFVYPYVATAIVKGKWAMTEYGDVLGPLLHEYYIDPDVRGCV